MRDEYLYLLQDYCYKANDCRPIRYPVWLQEYEIISQDKLTR